MKMIQNLHRSSAAMANGFRAAKRGVVRAAPVIACLFVTPVTSPSSSTIGTNEPSSTIAVTDDLVLSDWQGYAPVTEVVSEAILSVAENDMSRTREFDAAVALIEQYLEHAPTEAIMVRGHFDLGQLNRLIGEHSTSARHYAYAVKLGSDLVSEPATPDIRVRSSVFLYRNMAINGLLTTGLASDDPDLLEKAFEVIDSVPITSDELQFLEKPLMNHSLAAMDAEDGLRRADAAGKLEVLAGFIAASESGDQSPVALALSNVHDTLIEYRRIDVGTESSRSLSEMVRRGTDGNRF